MILFKKASELRKYLAIAGNRRESIGFVPTMGALHEGHVSLVKNSILENPVTLSSIFVNPTQFNDPRDFEKYPQTIEKDLTLLESLGCTVLFYPSVQEVYPGGTKKDEHFDLGYLETLLEGTYRPGHFQGVCMVMKRLLEIVRPDRLYMGQKDYQQCLVVKRLIEILGMQDSMELVLCPTLREKDGLAMSSRNLRLNPEDRKKASTIYKALSGIKDNLEKQDLELLKSAARGLLEQNGFKVDYVAVAGAAGLEQVVKWDGHQKLVALVAAYLGEVRLIDNMLLNAGESAQEKLRFGKRHHPDPIVM